MHKNITQIKIHADLPRKKSKACNLANTPDATLTSKNSASMGINSDWPKVWKDEGSAFIADKIPRDTSTIFIDGQILLMQSKVEGQKTWRDFALNFFGHRLSRAHGSFDHIVLAFDNYRVIPVFKSIEQAKRVKRGAPFPFHDGDALGDGPPDPAVWGSALQNRTYKTHVICVLVELLLDAYRPPRRGTSLTVDFVNSVRVAYHVDGSRTHGPLEQHSELGESDIKFMRYADACPRLVVDSIDSDVVLISMLYAKHGGGPDLFVRRLATHAHGEVVVKNSARSRYEVVHVQSLLAMLQDAARQSLGPEVRIDPAHLTCLLVVIMLLTGSDYSRGMPRIGPRKLWDALHVVIPALLMSSDFEPETGKFALNVERTVDCFFAEIYREEFAKHVGAANGYDALLAQLQASKLSDKVRESLPTRARLETTVRNLNWVMGYWHCRNSCPPAPLDGSCGFVPSERGAGVVFADLGGV